MALVNVGDSRSYRFHDGELTQITADHSLAEEMVRNGEMTRAEADGPSSPAHPDPGARCLLTTSVPTLADPAGTGRSVPALQ